MSIDGITLFPTSHEQSLPTFHVRTDLHERFTAFLSAEGFSIAEPPEPLEGTHVFEILLEAGTSMSKLRAAEEQFLAEL